MKRLDFISMAALLSAGRVQCFQSARSLAAVSARTNGLGAGSGNPLAAPAPPPLRLSESSVDNEAELERIQKEYDEITASLEEAKRRRAEALEKVEATREEQAAVALETKFAVDRLKNSLRCVIGLCGGTLPSSFLCAGVAINLCISCCAHHEHNY